MESKKAASYLSKTDLVTRLAKNQTLASLGPALAALAASCELVEVDTGEIVYAAEESIGPAYFILDGAIEVRAPASEAVPERLGPGALFGEQRLLGSVRLPRGDTAQAVTSARLVRIPTSTEPPPEEKATGLRSSLAEQFPDGGLGGIAQTRRQYAAGQIVFRQGEVANEVFIVENGVAQIFKEEAGQPILIGQVERGGFFGEKGVMSGQPRAATVIARDALAALVLDGAGFRDQVGRSAKAQAFLSALDVVYQLPRRGLVVQGQSVLDGIPAVTSSYSLMDGRTVLVARATAGDAVIFRQSPLPETLDWLTTKTAPGVRLGLSGDRLAAIESGKGWPGLERAAALLLDGEPVDAWRRALFLDTGLLEDRTEGGADLDLEIVCGCMGVRRSELARHIAGGADLDAIVKATGASTVCGSCRPRLIELMGGEGMVPARIVARRSLTPEIDSLRIVGRLKALPAAHPGQHIVLDGLIDGTWVRRSYTVVGLEGGKEGLEIAVRRETGGVFSNWLFQAGEDSQLRASSPAGTLRFPEDTRPIVCIVGGIGITPALALARGLASRALPTRQLTILHSVRSREDAAYAEEFEARAAQGELTYDLWPTRSRGRLSERAVSHRVADHPDAVFLVCGPAAFERAVCNHLAAAGVSGSEILIERFLPVAAALTETCPVLPPVRRSTRDVPTIRSGPTRDPHEETRALLRQYFIENAMDEAALDARIAEVGEGFEPTLAELAYAAKLAWRNSNRCIGRLYWKGLHVCDGRQVHDAEGVLDAMVEHLAVGTNGGRLRSALTVLPALNPRSPEILSPQLVRYAGYVNADGSVLGDPAHIDLTRLATDQGWRGAGTAFDVLPLLVRDADGQVHMRPLAPDQVLEVPLVHPDHRWFAELGLRWHALPAICNVYLDAFGRIYPVVFNGWYMGTEIGGRNLSDPYRYNVLPRIAQRLGLDRNNDASLWKDRAIVELNIAVLHSFRQAGVTMLDHHTASKEFFQFVEQEHACGRPANTDWSWVVPPISGSAVPQYHLGFPTEKLKPNFIGLSTVRKRSSISTVA